MGGAFSGRNDYATTPTVEQCFHLDVNGLPDGTLTPGARGELWWGDRNDDNPTIGVTAVATPPDGENVALELSYQTRPRSPRSDRDLTSHNYRIPITHTPCNFGGERPWFLCPGAGCGERVGKLYLPPGGETFACQDCHDLGYRSSRESGDPMQKALRRFQRAQEKLGVGPTTPESGSYDDLYPDRPKGMHRSTYRELMNELDAARDEWHDAWMGKMQAMTERLQE